MKKLLIIGIFSLLLVGTMAVTLMPNEVEDERVRCSALKIQKEYSGIYPCYDIDQIRENKILRVVKYGSKRR